MHAVNFGNSISGGDPTSLNHQIIKPTHLYSPTTTTVTSYTHFLWLFTYQIQEWRREKKGLMGTPRPDDAAVIASLYENQFLSFLLLFIVLCKSQLNNLIWNTDDERLWLVLLNQSDWGAVDMQASYHLMVDYPRTDPAWHQNNLIICHLKTALSFSISVDWPRKILLHDQSCTVGQQVSANRMKDSVFQFQIQSTFFRSGKAEHWQRCQTPFNILHIKKLRRRENRKKFCNMKN